MRRAVHCVLLLIATVRLASGQAAASVPAAMSVITEADLKHDLYAMAGDAMRGREAGTLDEMRASIWTAEQLRKIGVRPALDPGFKLER